MAYCSNQDFATTMLRTSNTIERCHLDARSFAGINNKAAQIDQIHRVMNHRSHQAEY